MGHTNDNNYIESCLIEAINNKYYKFNIEANRTAEILNEIRKYLLKISENQQSKKLNFMKIALDIEIDFVGTNDEEIRQEADVEFFNAIALFIYWRRNILKAKQDRFIFSFPNKKEGSEISFIAYLYRILFCITKGTKQLIFIKKNNKITEISRFRSKVSGGWGDTGLPIIPITSENYEIFGKNVFTFISRARYSNVESYEGKKYNKSDFQQALKKVEDRFTSEFKIDYRQIAKFSWEDYEKKDYSPIYLYCLLGIKKLLNDCKDDWVLEYLQYMNVMSFLLFYAVYEGIYNVKEGTKTKLIKQTIFSNRESFLDLYQTVNDYAIGLMQLMENVLLHTGGGIFTLRSLFRRSKRYDTQAGKFYRKPEQLADQWDFLQIYIADISKQINDKYFKLTDVFKFNLQKREEKKKEHYNKIEISNLTLREMFWPTDDENTIISDKPFSEEDSQATIYKNYNEYLSDSNNIAHHYGLQIFVFSVLNHKGHFYVSSGDLKDIEKFDSLEILDDMEPEEKANFPYNIQESLYFGGTYYNIQLPIKEIVNTNQKSNGFIPEDLTFSALENVEVSEENILYYKEDKPNDIYSNCIDFKSWNVKEGVDNKEKVIEENKNNLIEKAKLYIDSGKSIDVFIININNIKKNYIEYEILAKSLFSFVSYKCETIKLPKNVVIKTFTNSATLAVFINFYSQFYNRFGENKNIKPSPQIMLIYDNIIKKNEKTESFQNAIVLSGRYLGQPLYNYTTFSGGDDNRGGEISGLLSRIGRPSKIKKEQDFDDEIKNNPHYFDDIVFTNKKENKKFYTKKWQRDLKQILATEITDKKGYGVLIKNQHMHVSGVHLDRFYKVESLFTNAYWSKKLALELIKVIEKKANEIKKTKEIENVILYGYERLIEPLFINAKNIYSNKHKIPINYLIYDSGYHYTADKVASSKISGLNNDIINALQNETTLIVYVMSISTTCKTFVTMQNKLQNDLTECRAQEHYCAIIQLYDESKGKNGDKTCLHKDYFDFKTNKEEIEGFKFDGEYSLYGEKEQILCSYLVAVPAVWNRPETCLACYPSSGQTEKAIYSTDDTSLVPTFMIEKAKTSNEYIKRKYQFDFFEMKEGIFTFREALLYGHTVRDDSHYKSYIKTDRLLELLKNSDQWEEKFFNLKDAINENVKKSATNGIDIIVAPYHNTNQAFPALINEKVFNGNAHIISFNVAKIFRSNFEAEFDGYSDLIEKIKHRKKDVLNFVRFYYVDDQINTGETFYRTKSLVKNFFATYLIDGNLENNFNFSAVIVLIDRHSSSTKKGYIKDKAYYALFQFLSPNLRSGGDMCPLCKQVALDKNYLEKASLSSTAEFCVKRMIAHKFKEISERVTQEMPPELLDRGMRRVFAEEAIYKALDFSKYDSESVVARDEEWKNVYYRIVGVINDIICETNLFANVFNTSDKVVEKAEYLISFVKSLSRPFFTYRPTVATATIALLKNILRGICTDNKISLQLDSKKEITEIHFELKLNETLSAVIVNLLLACISGLANLNSTYLLNLNVTDNVLDWFEKNKDNMPKGQFQDGKNIFSYFPDKMTNSVSESYNWNRSFADYLRMAIFRVLRAEPYGKYRRGKYDEDLLEYLKAISLKDENNKKIDFYALIYLENGEIEAKQSVSSGIKILESRMLWGNVNLGDARNGLNKLIAKSEPYVIENKCLIPLTAEGYRDAFEIGYEIKYNNKKNSYYPVDSAYDRKKMQLSGKLILNDRAFSLLETTGISISFSDVQKPKYVFVLLRYFNLEQIFATNTNLREEIKPNSGELQKLVLRFDINDLYELGIKYVPDNSVNNHNAKQMIDIDLLSVLREIVILRSEFMQKIGNLLSNDALRRLVATSEENKALSLSKAAKHGNAKMEELTAKIAYNDIDKAFITIHKLMANRLLSEIYRVESEGYESDKFNDKDGKNPILCILPNLLEDNQGEKTNSNPIDEIINNILHEDGLQIVGKYKDGEEDENKSELFIKVDAKQKKGLLEKQNQAINLEELKSLCELDFCPYPSESHGHEKRKFVYFVLLLAYNALRHSKFYLINAKTEKDFIIKLESKDDKKYFICESDITDCGADDLEKAKKSITIPPWVRHEKENGITLWSISRYIKRCWDYKERCRHDTLTDVFKVEIDNNKFKIKIRLK